MLINLLEETEKALKNHSTSMKYVKFIRNSEGLISIADFVEMASKINYDNGYGEVYIDPSLTIVGKFFWLTRGNYDGAEGWVYHHRPKEPTIYAGDVTLRNTRTAITKSTFEEEVEKCGGFFEEE